MKSEKIVRAALYNTRSFLTYSLPSPARHHDVIKWMSDRNVAATPGYIQGFVTSKGRFVNREEAAAIATKAKQILPAPGGAIREVTTLYSEDIW